MAGSLVVADAELMAQARDVACRTKLLGVHARRMARIVAYLYEEKALFSDATKRSLARDVAALEALAQAMGDATAGLVTLVGDAVRELGELDDYDT